MIVARAEDGFSLIEILVVLALSGLVLSALALITGQWLPHWRQGFSRVEQAEHLALAVDRMAADLRAAEFVPPDVKSKHPLFAGTSEALTFVRTAVGPNVAPGLEIVTFAPERERGGTVLTRRTAAYVPRPEPAPEPVFGAPVPLLQARYRVSFSYAGRDGVWRDGWTGAEELPRAVRIVVREGGSGRALAASTAVTLRTELPAACVTDITLKICAVTPPGTGDGAPAAGEAGR